MGSPSLAVDWRSEVTGFFGEKIDHLGAIRFLEANFDSLNMEDKPIACGLLAFLYKQAGERENEYKRLGEYFEKYGAFGSGFHFLPFSTQNAIALYLRDWMVKYPWVLKIGFIKSGASEPLPSGSSRPGQLFLGVEMAGETYYKLSEGDNVLKGGLFKRGFNSIGIETDKILRESRSCSYVLEFKSGDLIVRRELVFDVRLDASGVMAKPVPVGENIAYELRLYLGDTLLASSRKTVPSSPQMKIDVPPPSGAYDPWGPGYQNEPEIPSSFPVFAIPALIKELIKSLKKKDEVEPVPPVELRSEITISFQKKNAAGHPMEVRARILLGLKDIRFLPFSSSPQPK